MPVSISLSCCFALFAATQGGGDAPNDRVAMFNEYGAPVVDASGTRVEYSRVEMEMQRYGQSRSFTDTIADQRGSGTFLPSWRYYAFGTGIGASDFCVSEVDGTPELLFGAGGTGFGGNRYWMILNHNADSAEYDQVYVSPIYDDGVRRLLVGDFIEGEGNDSSEGDGPEVLVLTSVGEVELWSQRSRELIVSFSTMDDPENLYVADVDLDGSLDLLITSSSRLEAYGFDGSKKWTKRGVGGSDVIAAQMDLDPALEIALTDGTVLDGETLDVEWTWADGFGFELEAGDIDGDGMDELIGAEYWSYIWAYDVDTKLPKWTLDVFNIGSIGLTDIDGDDQLELLVGEAQWGDQIGYDALTLQREFSIDNPEHGTTDTYYGDVDQDGKIEVIWGSGHSSTGPDHLFIADWETEAHEWSNVHLDGPFRGPVFGDVDGDGVEEIATITNESDSGYGAGRIVLFDATTMRPRAISQEVGSGLGWSGTHEVKLRDVDGDSALEFVVSTSTTYDGTIEIYDYDGATTFTKIWGVPTPLPDGSFRSADVLDLDSDPALDVIGICGGYLYSYDFESGQQEWRSVYLSGTGVQMEVAQVNDNDQQEILVLVDDGDLYVFDALKKELTAIVDVDGESLRTLGKLILIGDDAGQLKIYEFDGTEYAHLGSLDVGSGRVNGFTVGPPMFLWVGVEGELRLYDAGRSDPLWVSPRYGDNFGAHVVVENEVPRLLPSGLLCVTAGPDGVVGFR